MIKLDDRLQVIYELVQNNVKITDVGSDHGYLITKLMVDKKCSVGNCVDINEKCLQKAEKLAYEYNVYNQIKFFVSDGLTDISEDSTDDIVIAGMGSELIIKIIDKCKWLKKMNNKHLILQPMLKPWVLREYLYLNGFEIKEEKVVKSQKFFYVVMLVQFSGKAKQPSLIEQFTGVLSEKITPEVRDYFLFLSKKFEMIAKQMESSSNYKKSENYNYYRSISETILNLLI